MRGKHGGERYRHEDTLSGDRYIVINFFFPCTRSLGAVSLFVSREFFPGRGPLAPRDPPPEGGGLRGIAPVPSGGGTGTVVLGRGAEADGLHLGRSHAPGRPLLDDAGGAAPPGHRVDVSADAIRPLGLRHANGDTERTFLRPPRWGLRLTYLPRFKLG